MIKTNTNVVHIEQVRPTQALSKDQKRFNQLTKKIEQLKQQLREWQDTIPQIHQRVVEEYQPLQHAYNSHRLELVYLLDNSYGHKLFKKHDKEKLRHIILMLVDALIEEDYDADLQMLHDKYSDVSLEEKKQDSNDFMKSMLEDVFELEMPDDIDINNPEQLREFMQERLQQEQARVQAKQQEYEARRAGKKKTARQQQKQAQQEAEALNIRKTIQEVYRKLAAALHPDREQDMTERDRKTELMQRVNVAYNKKDLMQLLELQLEAEQIDQRHINSISEERLKYYNKILKEQSDELQQEIDDLQFSVGMQFNVPLASRCTAKNFKQFLKRDINDLKFRMLCLQEELMQLQDPQNLKQWLKGYRIP